MRRREFITLLGGAGVACAACRVCAAAEKNAQDWCFVARSKR